MKYKSTLGFTLTVSTAIAVLSGCSGGNGKFLVQNLDSDSRAGVQATKTFTLGYLVGDVGNSNAQLKYQRTPVTGIAWEADITRLEQPSPTRASDAGRIVFQRTVGSNTDLYSVNPDGSNFTRLTWGASVDASPALSRFTDTIAFQSNRNGTYDIYTMNLDGSSQTAVYSGNGDQLSPAWSPTGKLLAFVHTNGSNSEIYVGTKNLTNNTSADIQPAWSPDGSKIAFVSNRSKYYNIWLMNSDGTNLKQLTSLNANDSTPDWSPDGSKILFSSNRNSSNGDIYSMNADGTNVVRLTSGGSINRSAHWSPNGAKILFRSTRTGTGLYSMNADGTNVYQLTNAQDDNPIWVAKPDRRYLIGINGRMGTRARGVVYTSHDTAQTGGIVTFDSASPHTAYSITFPSAQNTDATLMGAKIIARDNTLPIGRLDYWNRTLLNPTRITWTGTAVGANVQSSLLTGNIIALIPFGKNGRSALNESQDVGNVRTLQGDFLGVWDSEGKNLAPDGAREVQIDKATERIISIR